MSNERYEKKEQPTPTSILDIGQRISEGRHSVITFLIALAVIGVVWVFHVAGVVSQGSLIVAIVVVAIIWAVITNAEFAMREWLLVDWWKRRAKKADEYSPDTRATDQVMGLTLDPVQYREDTDERS